MEKGVLIINLGTPDSPSTKDVRSYLGRFLSDRRIIKIPKIIWQLILHGIILRTRPKKSAELYKKIWTREGSPLLIYTQKQQQLLQKRLPDYQVAYAMSYSQPFIPETLEKLLQTGVKELTVIPLYPQYSGTTVGSIFDEVMKYFYKSDKIVDIKFIHTFQLQPAYIQFYVDNIKAELLKENYECIVFSYHGIPKNYVEKEGDPYPTYCTATTEAIMEKIGEVPYVQTYQSKFGPGEWLTPATDSTMKNLPNQGVKKILVVAPGFVSDCLETIEELEEENRNYFMDNGGETFTYLPCLNDSEALIETLAKLVKG